MYLADYHTHTHLSPDSSASARDMVQAAVAAGLGEICFTDHVDLLDMNGNPQGFSDWESHRRQYEEAKVYTGPDLRLALGLELGEPWEAPQLSRDIYDLPEMDFIIGSVHNLDTAHSGLDLFLMNYAEEAFCYETLGTYVGCLEKIAAMDCFDVLGHIVYPLRYMNANPGNHIRMDPFFSRLEGIFRTLIAKDKGIELNTARGKQIEVWRPILALYHDCGGRIVTLGSDAHRPDHVAKGLTEAAAMLEEFGFDLAVYEKHCPKLISL